MCKDDFEECYFFSKDIYFRVIKYINISLEIIRQF